MEEEEHREDMDVVESDESGSDSENGESKVTEKKVYLPGNDMEEGEELICDESAYWMYHQAQTGAPCLSFDVIPDDLGEKRQDYPLTCFMVAGTQAQRAHTNSVIVMKMSNLHKTKKDDIGSDEEDSDESEDEDEKPELEAAIIKHTGSVNRVRCTKFGTKTYAATWSETGKVYIWDLERPLQAVNDSQVMATYTMKQESPSPVFEFSGHQVEGFALDWCPTTEGRLVTGDCSKNIHVWNPQEDGTWHVDQRPYVGHTASVEDLQWSPNEQHVFASCSVDKTVRVWDARAPVTKACMLTASDAHERDVNVIHWNRSEPFILSGGDDGFIKVWDLRQFQKGAPVALFKHHTAPITSIEWHPTDSSVFAASGSDDQVTLWDLAVERDQDTATMKPASSSDEGKNDEPDVPPQLLFIHQGQTDIKEIHWHRQLPGVVISTAHSGFNIFRTVSV